MSRWLLILALCAAGCGCQYEVVADITIQASDGGVTKSTATHCAQGCGTSKDCASGWHCSLILNSSDGPPGLCFENFHQERR